MCPDSPTPAPRQPWALTDDMVKAIENEVVPRMLVTHRVGGVPPERFMEVTRRLGEADVERLIGHLTSGRDADSDQFIDDLVQQGVDSEAIYLDLLAPTARRLGELWSQDDCDFVEVSIALGRIQRVLRNLSTLFLGGVPAEYAVGRVLLAGVPGEQHTLGLFMVAEFFVRDGWLVTVGPPLVQDDVRRLLREYSYDIVGFSVACDTRLAVVRREINRVRRSSRNSALQVLVGGRVFNDNPELVERVGADASASDGREATHVAARLLAEAKRDLAVNHN